MKSHADNKGGDAGKEEMLRELEKKEGKSKGADKKVPKRVREMQEALARRKEAEERMKREEEERLRKEEEEQCRLEELEEDKRRKKEKEKEKFQRKKAEGKILTPKQREEARRLESMRNQILANAGLGIPLPSPDAVVQTKRAVYNQKRTHRQANSASPDKAVENVEVEEEPREMVDEESINAEAEAAEEDEWDAKC